MISMHANIPFEFRMGDKLIPSGVYLIQMSDGSVILREEGGRLVSASLMTLPKSRTTQPDRGELVFNRFGSEYFLASVWTPFSRQGRVLMKSKREKDLLAQSNTAVETASAISK
jgi:hypothetical protein